MNFTGCYKCRIPYFLIVALLIIISAISLVACKQNANDDEVITDIGDSSKFTEEEITKAIEIVKDSFGFPASTLTKIMYNEEEAEKLTKIYLEGGKGSKNGAKPENVIVLLSNFDVDDSGDNPVLNPGSTYENYQWILIRDDKKGEWIIDDFGY